MSAGNCRLCVDLVQVHLRVLTIRAEHRQRRRVNHIDLRCRAVERTQFAGIARRIDRDERLGPGGCRGRGHAAVVRIGDGAIDAEWPRVRDALSGRWRSKWAGEGKRGNDCRDECAARREY